MSLKVRNLSFSYGKKVILKSINTDFESGEVTVIAGANGSGKSTLVKTIMTLVDIKKNQIYIHNRDILTLTDIERAKKIGYVSQNMPNDFDFTVYETVEMGRYPYKKEWNIKKDREFIESALKLTDTLAFKDRSINTLSGGELQRVLLARAIAGDPDYLVLDEPSSNLDIRHNISMMKLINRLTRELNITTIMVLHDLNMIYRYSDNIVILKDGSILDSGKTNNIFTPKTIKETYNIDSSIICDKDGMKHIVTT